MSPPLPPLEKLSRELDIIENRLISMNRDEYSLDTTMAVRGQMYKLLRMMHKQYAIGIVTALPEEFAAVATMLDQAKSYEGDPCDPNKYLLGTIPCVQNPHVPHSVVLTLLVKPGNNMAVAAVANLLRSFSAVRDILMVGIAGGVPHPERPATHVRLGDVVISKERGVVQYDMQKVEVGSTSIRDTSTVPSARMIQAVNDLEANRLRGEHPWEEHIGRALHLEGSSRPSDEYDVLHGSDNPSAVVSHPDDLSRRNGQPKIHYGLIGSANTLLRDPTTRDRLRDRLGIRAVEMEGSGIADGTWDHAAQYILIRGICDYCDGYKNDDWHVYAAVVAAAYARAVIETLRPIVET